jgi:uncharacterized protein YbjT (DUF2867 family)
MARVLVCGATGTTGSAVLSQLRAAGVGVRAMTRSQESADRLRGSGLEAVVADLGESATLPAALDGVDAVYLAYPASPDLPEHEGSLARAAVDAGVGHLVKLSVIDAAPDSSVTFQRLHFDAEQRIRESGVSWTMVRSNGFMQNTLAWAPQLSGGTVYGPVMDARWSIIDARDMAGVATAVLRDPGSHGGQIYSVTGPEASSPREQIAILSELLGREIAAQEVSIDQAKAAMQAAGIPARLAEWLGELLALYAEGRAQQVSPHVESITGHRPKDYRQFATDHHEAFATH